MPGLIGPFSLDVLRPTANGCGDASQEGEIPMGANNCITGHSEENLAECHLAITASVIALCEAAVSITVSEVHKDWILRW